MFSFSALAVSELMLITNSTMKSYANLKKNLGSEFYGPKFSYPGGFDIFSELIILI